MDYIESLDTFIVCLARKIALIYPSNYADIEDYIQTGHLTLIKINRRKQQYRSFLAYAIVAIANTMRNAALDAMCSVSAPRKIKKQLHKIDMLMATGKTDVDICTELDIDRQTLNELQLLLKTESFHRLFKEPTTYSQPFSILDDLLLSSCLTEDDKIFIQAQLDDTIDDLDLSRKQQWSKVKKIRTKFIRSGYGIK